MPFRLFYRGLLKSNGDKDDKHKLRICFHPQIEKLWKEEPLLNHQKRLTKQTDPWEINVLYPLENHNFACVVTERLKVYAELDILFLRPQPPGKIIVGGDIDNRLKTLLDGLRRPQNVEELPSEPARSLIPNPCYCLLSEDALITRVSVTTDTFLDARDKDEVILIIATTIRKTLVTIWNMSYIE